MSLNEYFNDFHKRSVDAGWWPDEDRNNPYIVALKLALVHSEISEALEGDRKGLMDDKLPHRTSLEVELADAIIRIGDLAGFKGLDLQGAIEEKLEYNKIRLDHQKGNRQLVGGKRY